MEKWTVTCFLLCLFGLLKELRPSEPFLTEYLIGWKNLTAEVITQQVFPVWTYSYLALLIIVFLITDYVRYKPVIILEGFCFIITWCVLIWGQGVAAMQGVEFMYAMATSTQVAYTTYIYAKVTQEKFQIVTAYTQAALLTGRCLAGILAQVLVATGACDYYTLNFISLATVSVATVVAFVLPPVSRSLYFHRDDTDERLGETRLSKTKQSMSVAFSYLRSDFFSAYSNMYLIKWSIWWAFAMCGYFQVINYIQPLWETVASFNSNSIYNGAVEAVQTLLSALATVAIGYAPINWSQAGEPLMALMSILEGGMLYMAATADNIWVAYVGYIVYSISYNITITIASSEVAKGLKQASYGLIFGINTFLALLFQTILTLVVADNAGLALLPRDQFQVYGGYYFVLGGVFLVITAYSAGLNGCQPKSERVPLSSSPEA